jgi:hypothetical protein
MEIIVNKYKKVSDFCYELFKIAELKLYYHKFSNKIYSNFQKLFLLVYKQFRKFTYEELSTDLESNSELKTYLGFKKIPHYSTLVKFAKSLSLQIIERLILAFKRFVGTPKKVAIDATGITLDNASLHYCKRIGLPTKKRPFMKASFIVDMEKYLILLPKLRKKSRHDTIDAKPMIKKFAKHYTPEIFFGDRGYDDEKIFKLVFENLGAYPMILQRRIEIDNYRRQGYYRKRFFKEFDYCQYLERSKIETVNSMIKRRFGSNTKTRIDKTQKVEILLRIVAFNIDRLLRIGNQVILIFIKIIRVSQ